MALYKLHYRCECGATWSWVMSEVHKDFCVKCHRHPVLPYKSEAATEGQIAQVTALNSVARAVDEWRKTTDRIALSEKVAALPQETRERIIAAARAYEFAPHSGPVPIGFDEHDNFTVTVDGESYQCGIRFWDIRTEEFSTAFALDMSRRLLRICHSSELQLPFN